MCKCIEPTHYNCKCPTRVKKVDTITVDIYMTTEDLNTLRGQIELAYANKQSWFNDMRFGIKSKDRPYREQLFLLILFFNNWNQHSDGTTTGLTNYATRQEFSKAVNTAKRIVGATILN